MISAGLIQHREGYFLTKRPAEQSVIIAAHDNDEHRQVRVLTHSVAVQVDTCTQIVTCISSAYCIINKYHV